MYEAIAVDGMEVVQTTYIAGKIGHDVTPSFVGLALNQLSELDETKFEAHPGQLQIVAEKRAACLTPYGTRVIEKELRDPDSVISKYRDKGLEDLEDQLIRARGIPASDRIVLRSDNEPAAEEAVGALADLENELRSNSNEVGDISGDDLEIAIGEVDRLTQMANQRRIRVAPLLALARKTLGWIAEKAGAAGVGDLAKRALATLFDWLCS